MLIKQKQWYRTGDYGKGGTLTVEDHKTEVVRRFKYLATVINDSNFETE